jgi:hypothetical protein
MYFLSHFFYWLTSVSTVAEIMKQATTEGTPASFFKKVLQQVCEARLKSRLWDIQCTLNDAKEGRKQIAHLLLFGVLYITIDINEYYYC